MSAFSAWALSIVGVVLLGLLVDIMLPDGQTNKYIKSVFAILTVFVITAPIPALLKTEIDLSDIFGEQTRYEIDKGFMDTVNRQKADSLKSAAEAALAEAGYENAEFSVIFESKNNELVFSHIFVDISNLEYSGGGSNTNINDGIKQIFINIFGVGGEVISIYG
jgi:stage III sporulation protein AF